MMRAFLAGLVSLLMVTGAWATTPVITGVSGSISTGGSITITGTTMLDEDRSTWITTETFEKGSGASLSADGWTDLAGTVPVHASDYVLIGSNSAKFTMAKPGGESCPGTEYGSSMYRVMSPSYFRFYYRVDSNFDALLAGASYLKMFRLWTSGSASLLDSNIYPGWPTTGYSGSYFGTQAYNLPTATPAFALRFPVNRWICYEAFWDSANGQMTWWIDGQQSGQTPADANSHYTVGLWQLGPINGCPLAAGVTSYMWMNGFAAGSSRIYPATTVEIGNSSNYNTAIKVRQPLNTITDTSINITADLTGLGAGPYYLWVTNNRQQRSNTYSMSDGGGSDTTAPVVSISTSNSTVNANALTVAGTATDTSGVTSCKYLVGSAPAALLSESFENTSWNDRGWYDNTSNGTITSSGCYSGNCLQWTWAAGEAKPTNGDAIRHLFTPSDNLHISFYVKFATGWRGSQQTYHPHMIYIPSDLDDAYCGLSGNYLQTYIEFLSDVGSPYAIRPVFAIQDQLRTNATYGTPPNNLTATTENRSVNYCNTPPYAGVAGYDCYLNGTSYYSVDGWTNASYAVTTNTWHHVELYLKMNTISGSVGQYDGILQEWIDGTQVLNYTNILYRTNQDATKKWAQFVLGPYIGDGSPISQTMYIDELSVTSNSTPDASHGTACTGTSSWSCSTTGYTTGANTLYVGCGDAAGNWGSDSITVTYTPTASQVTGLRISPTGTIVNGATIK